MTATRLDQAHAAMMVDETDDLARLAFFAAFADTELFVVLKSDGERPSEAPLLFDTSDGAFLLAFDTEDRLTTFTEGPAHYAALSGRAIAAMVRNDGVGVALNPEVAGSSMLISADTLVWLSDILSREVRQITAIPKTLHRPSLPAGLLDALDTKLASAEGLARAAILVDATYESGETISVIALIDPVPGAEQALARSVAEAVTFLGAEGDALDVMFIDSAAPIYDRLAAVGVRIDLPTPEVAMPQVPDPSVPPKLR